MSDEHSAAALSAVIDIAVDAVIVLDERFRIARFNLGAERIFGWTEAELLGQPLDQLLPRGARDMHASHMAAFAQGESDARDMGARQTIHGQRRDGTEFPAEASIARVTVGGARTFMVVLRDVSARKHREAGQQMLATAGWVLAASLDVESTLAAIAEMPLPVLGDWSVVELLGPDGDVRRGSAAHALGVEQVDMAPLIMPEARPLPEPLPEYGTARLAHGGLQATSLPAEGWILATFPEPTAKARAQSLGAEHVLVVPLRAGARTIGALSLVRTDAGAPFTQDDVAIAEQFGASAALALENTRLYQEAREAVLERDELLAIVSHDLRNPVNAIVMLTGGLMAQSDAGAPVQVDLDQLTSVRGAARLADGLIQDLQDVSRITAGRLAVELQVCDVSDVVIEAVDLFEPTAVDAELTLSCEIPTTLPRVLADPLRVQQVLSNLLVNAIKFTPPGGSVVVRVSIAADGGALSVAVSDTGPGIAPEDVPRLFERYWQAPRLLRAGSGLGLFIAKGIVEAHGGIISVDTAPGRGTTMRFTLPVVV
jgi:PAS domain S-box-containing protein